jgi:hypothetical protein
MRPYIVRQGDYVRKIAAQIGCDEDNIWNDEKNKGLKDSGRTPELLCPGDVLFVPDAPTAPVPLALGSSNQFCGTVPPVKVTVVFHHDGAPLAGEAYRATGAGYESEGTSDGDGRVDLTVTTLHQHVDVFFVHRGLCYTIGVGHLDPVTESSGQDQRLTNLGHLPSDLPFADEADVEDEGRVFTPDFMRKAALFDFQRAQGLSVTAEADEATMKALEQAHGC